MRIAQLVGAVVIAMTVAGAVFAQSTVYGIGNNSCGTYLGFKTTNQTMYKAEQTWTTGYLTAMAQQLHVRDLLAGTDLGGATAWLDNWCAQNPIETYYRANYQLVIFLARRLGQGG